eukprot:scaffold1954_cov268-Pinguiococcus_pyrenoidosus.AAC.122
MLEELSLIMPMYRSFAALSWLWLIPAQQLAGRLSMSSHQRRAARLPACQVGLQRSPSQAETVSRRARSDVLIGCDRTF